MILRLAMEQSAYDSNCKAEDFLRGENVFCESIRNPKAHRYLELPLVCDLTSYGSNALRSGFKPGWMQLSAKSNEYIEGMLK